jgi:hypothetical protein
MLSKYIISGQIDRATAIVNGEAGQAVQTVRARDVDKTFMADNARVLGQILRIKKNSHGKKKIVSKDTYGGKVMKLEQPYDRLIWVRYVSNV